MLRFSFHVEVMIHLNCQVNISHYDVAIWISSAASVGLAIRLDSSLRRCPPSLRSLARGILGRVEIKVTLLPLLPSRILLLDLGRFHHHSLLLSSLVLTCPSHIISSVLPKIYFVKIVVARIHILNLILNVVDLTNVNWLVKQMLPLDLFLIEGVGWLTGSWVMSGSWLRWWDGWLLVLLLVVLAHDTNLLLLICTPAFTPSWLLYSRCLMLGRGNALLVLGGTMAAYQLHLGLDLSKDFIHASHGAYGSIHSTISSYVVKISSLRLLSWCTGSSGWGWVLLHFAFRDWILVRLCITWGTSYPAVLSLKVI